MKYYVNGDCIACGLCTTICPEVFSLGESGTAEAAGDPVSERDAAAAAEAMESCPVDAIEEA